MNKTEIIKIVAFGDSITEGTYGGADVSQTYPSLLQNVLTKNGINTEVVNTGIPGETAVEGLKRFKWHVLPQNPNYVLIMYGANDSYIPPGYRHPVISIEDFTSSIVMLIKMAKENHICPILMTTTPLAIEGFFDDDVSNSESHTNYLEKFMVIIREIATKEGITLIDHYQTWKLKDAELGILAKYLPDGVHPNAAGNLLIAETTAVSIIRLMNE